MSLARKVLAHVGRNPIRYSIGGVLALVFGGVYLYRRRQAKQLAGADLGTAATEMGKAVKRQVEAAKGRMPLADYREAEHSNQFYGTPSDDSGAYYRAAFWLAVAARCSQAWSLADLADAAMQKGIAAQRAVLFSGGSVANRSSILLTAAQAIQAVAPTNPGARAAAAALGSQSDPGKLATRDQINKDRSAAGKIKGTYEASKQDVSDAAGKVLDIAGMLSNGVRMLLGMDPPPGGPEYPWWKTWAIRGGVAAVVMLGVRVIFAPEYAAAKAVVVRAGTAVQNPVAAIRAALTTSGV